MSVTGNSARGVKFLHHIVRAESNETQMFGINTCEHCSLRDLQS